jgi:DNA-binding SARP family transcriptional activator
MTAPPWRIELLGWLRAERAGVAVTRFRTQKVAALLARLALFGDRPHPREALVELLWPEADPSRGRNNLSQALSALRRDIEGAGGGGARILEADRAGVLAGLASLAAIERAEGRFERAARLRGAVLALRERMGAPLPPADRPEHEAEVALLREALGERALARALDAGRSLSWEEAAAEALGERISGHGAR